MVAKRKRHKPEFKAQVALEAYKGNKTINQLASEHEVAAVQVSQWKRQLLQGVPEVFGRTKVTFLQTTKHKLKVVYF
ncbi:transposase [Endozoicomonas euniceicola]|uniref:Transposase n=1 Tax=Endozoicomonas euniceicola TaxID=1234143 RepID=A0ABY6GTB9_9GAMM|nr:transposase [Endozoicomonas euniceicola]UYM15496.1 transposase [Endozoicomonas euniceicola]UYM15989.1 transposase [Endozoicomonas euniceicola]